MGAKKNVDMSSTTDTVKIVKDQTAESAENEHKSTDVVDDVPAANRAATTNEVGTNAGADVELGPKVKTKPTSQRSRSKKYKAQRSRLDKTKKYSVSEAVALVKDLSYSKFDGTVSVALVVREVGQVCSVSLPHSTGKSIRAVIVDEKVLAQIEAGDVEGIDVLIAEPQYMPKLAKFGKVLGPKGLMPNPKSGTLTPNPSAKKKELEAGTLTLKTNKKEPVLHVPVGKVSMEASKLADNVEALKNAVGTKLVKMTLSATMSPGVRVEI